MGSPSGSLGWFLTALILPLLGLTVGWARRVVLSWELCVCWARYRRAVQEGRRQFEVVARVCLPSDGRPAHADWLCCLEILRVRREVDSGLGDSSDRERLRRLYLQLKSEAGLPPGRAHPLSILWAIGMVAEAVQQTLRETLGVEVSREDAEVLATFGGPGLVLKEVLRHAGAELGLATCDSIKERLPQLIAGLRGEREMLLAHTATIDALAATAAAAPQGVGRRAKRWRAELEKDWVRVDSQARAHERSHHYREHRSRVHERHRNRRALDLQTQEVAFQLISLRMMRSALRDASGLYERSLREGTHTQQEIGALCDTLRRTVRSISDVFTCSVSSHPFCEEICHESVSSNPSSCRAAQDARRSRAASG